MAPTPASVAPTKSLLDAIVLSGASKAAAGRIETSVPHLPSRGTLIVYPDGTDHPGIRFDCYDGRVSNAISAIAGRNIPLARWALPILNAAVLAEVRRNAR